MELNIKRCGSNFNHKNHHLNFKLLVATLSLTLLLVFLIPSISAVEVSMDSEYAQGETFLAKFSGNFVDQITSDNVFFCRGTNCNIPMAYSGVVKINSDFYVYAILTDKQPGNYSIRIEGVRYYRATQIIDDDIVSNFTISEETAAFSVNPSVVNTNENFAVELQNLRDNSIIINIDADSSKLSFPSSLELNTGEKETISFTLDAQAARGLIIVDFTSENTSYSMPVYLNTENITISELNETTEDFDLEFQPQEAEVSMSTNSNSRRILYLKNTGAETLEDISFNISSVLERYVSVSPENIDSLDPGEIKQVEFDISSGPEEAIFEGIITAHNEETATEFILTLNLIYDFIPAESETEELSILSLCGDLGGTICADTEECGGDIVRTRNGDCCVAPLVCQEPKKSSSGKIIGWILLLIVFIAILWFFKKKYKGVKKIKPF